MISLLKILWTDLQPKPRSNHCAHSLTIQTAKCLINKRIYKCNQLKQEAQLLCNRRSSVFFSMMRRGSVTAHVERKSDPLKWEKLLTEQHNSVSLGSVRANLSTELRSYTSDVTEKLRCDILNYLFILDLQWKVRKFSRQQKCSDKECVRSASRVFSINNAIICCK